MAKYQNLKTAISTAIKTNGNQEITGQVLQDVLNSIVSVIGDNYTFAGVATPSTNPGTPDQNVVYVALQAGTYTNFNGTVLPNGISLLMWDGTWTSEILLSIDEKPTAGSNDLVKSGGALSISFNNMFLGKGQTYSDTKIYGLIPKHIYRLVLQDENYVRDEASDGVLLGVYNYYNNVETILYSNSVAQGKLNKTYDFVCPENSDYIAVGGRANAGVEVRFCIEDITYIEETSEQVGELSANGSFVWKKTGINRTFDADYYKIPYNAKAGDLIRLKFDSNNISSFERTYVKYKNQNEKTEIFNLSINYVVNGNIYQFVAEDDIEYFTFSATVTSDDTYIIFSILQKVDFSLSYKDKEYWDIYQSSTDNILDVQNVLNGVSIDNETLDITEDKRGVLSKPIYVGDHVGEKLTISGISVAAKRSIVFLDSAAISKNNVVYWFNLQVPQRTITIPKRSKYAIIVLRNKDYDIGSSYGLVDYANMKLALGEDAATQDFDGKYLFNGLEYEDTIFTSSTNNILDTSLLFNDKGLTNVPPYFIAGQNNIMCCGPIYVEGLEHITFRYNSVFTTGRKWVIFTNDRSRTEESVVGFGYLPTNSSGDLKEITLSVPDEAKWFYIKIQVINEVLDDALQMTCAKGIVATTDIFKKAVSGIYNMPIAGVSKASEVADNDILSFEKIDTWKRFLPYSIGAPVIEDNTLAPWTGAYDRAHLLFFTDNHIEDNVADPGVDNVRNTIDFINSGKIKFDAILNGGDTITPFNRVAKSTAVAWLEKFFDIAKTSKYPFLWAKGNHDSNDWNNLPADALGDADWSSLIYDYMESSYGFIRQTKSNGEKSSYGYYDIVAHKIRVIIVDCQDIDRTPVDANGNCKYYGGNAFHISDEQFVWMADNALSFSENGWGVVIVLHMTFSQKNVWYTVENMPSSIQKFYNMVKAFNSHDTYVQQAYTYTPDSFYNLTAFSKDFSFNNLTDKPKVICWLIGHEHSDRVVTQDGMNLIWTLNGSSNNNASDQRVPKIIGTQYQTAFDVISIDTKLRKIWMVRYGSGVNCYGVGGDRFLPNGLSY